MQKTIKYIIPLLCLCYFIAFFEIEISASQHQTYNDEYDTYTFSPTKKLNSNQVFLDTSQLDFCLSQASPDLNLPVFPRVSFHTYKEKEVQTSQKKLFVTNCVWLI